MNKQLTPPPKPKRYIYINRYIYKDCDLDMYRYTYVDRFVYIYVYMNVYIYIRIDRYIDIDTDCVRQLALSSSGGAKREPHLAPGTSCGTYGGCHNPRPAPFTEHTVYQNELADGNTREMADKIHDAVKRTD